MATPPTFVIVCRPFVRLVSPKLKKRQSRIICLFSRKCGGKINRQRAILPLLIYYSVLHSWYGRWINGKKWSCLWVPVEMNGSAERDLDVLD
ncbi:hypothetical protein TNIN_186801 [Trichonephila inaurata madagascariensis]|uniref:Uncharacterized protein n=1 Tax=Trichonephila inaurata madagascariensis TaxID=2747483 RepID=A0A8X6YA17_9ARAC|nr:hypothetical protein TNIN_186801 [Trichonephila inaurata madagascariensis]